MQSGSGSFSVIEMASIRMKMFIFKNANKIKNEEVNSLELLVLRISGLLEMLKTFYVQEGHWGIWAGAVSLKSSKTKKSKKGTNRPTNRPTDIAGCRVA